MASLSRSNGSLAGTANNSTHPAASSSNSETDANGNSKPRSRTQVRLHHRHLSQSFSHPFFLLSNFPPSIELLKPANLFRLLSPPPY
jgi:hypothetical protein